MMIIHVIDYVSDVLLLDRQEKRAEIRMHLYRLIGSDFAANARNACYAWPRILLLYSLVRIGLGSNECSLCTG